MDKIIEVRASYEILSFDIGRTNDDVSRIRNAWVFRAIVTAPLWPLTFLRTRTCSVQGLR